MPIPRILMRLVLLLAIFGFVVNFLPSFTLSHGQGWAVDTWSVTGWLVAICAAVVAIQSRSGQALTAAVLGVVVGVSAALFASPDVQGPGLDVLAWLADFTIVVASVTYLQRSGASGAPRRPQ